MRKRREENLRREYAEKGCDWDKLVKEKMEKENSEHDNNIKSHQQREEEITEEKNDINQTDDTMVNENYEHANSA